MRMTQENMGSQWTVGDKNEDGKCFLNFYGTLSIFFIEN